MKLGLNLSFAVKRWLKPEQLALICKRDLKVDHVQFTWDLIDPWWPEEQRQVLASQYREAFSNAGISIDGSFGGLASYTFAHFLAPSKEQREIALTFFKRAVDLTSELGCTIMGTPIGGMDNSEAFDPVIREERYNDAIRLLKDLAVYAKGKGIEEIQIEATPLYTEFPHDTAASNKLMKDLEDAEVRYTLLIDWGHALFKPLMGEEADMKHWYETCKNYIGAIHLQQTDGLLDCHWDFTKEGIVDPEYILEVTEETGLEDIPIYLEVVPPFEETDQYVLDGMIKSMNILRAALR